MLIVNDVYLDATKIFGHCDEPTLLTYMTDAVRLLANKGETDALVGAVDMCVTDRCVTLHREIETVLAVNIGGRPALARDQLFSFHLNGPGDFCTSCRWTWTDGGQAPTYRDLRCPGKLVAFLDRPEDEGKKLKVFGFDNQNRPLQTEINGSPQEGYLVPTIYGYALPEVNAPMIGRITAIVKDPTFGNVRLSTFDNSTSTGTLLGIFEPDEVIPQYRRIRVDRACDWVRIFFRRRTLDLTTRRDRIYLHSRLALVLAMRAVKKYSEADIGNALQFEAQATRILTEQESVLSSPAGNPIQVVEGIFKCVDEGID